MSRSLDSRADFGLVGYLRAIRVGIKPDGFSFWHGGYRRCNLDYYLPEIGRREANNLLCRSAGCKDEAYGGVGISEMEA